MLMYLKLSPPGFFGPQEDVVDRDEAIKWIKRGFKYKPILRIRKPKLP